MSSTPAVSWLLTVKNGMPYLTETLASISAQTFTDYELVVWLMESNDGTEEELSRWIPSRLPGRVYKSGTICLGTARAELVKHARTELCACIDADDVNEPDRLARQVAFLRDHPDVALVGCQLRVIDEKSHETGEIYDYPVDHDNILIGFIASNRIGQSGVLFRRAAVLSAGNYDKDLFFIEDYDLWMRLACAHRLANMPDCLVRYRFHSQSLTRCLERMQRTEELTIRTFASNAPTLFGLDRTTALALRELRYPCTLRCAWKIARHLGRRRHVSPWRVIREPSLLDRLWALTGVHDHTSRLAYAILDRRPGTLRALFRTYRRRVGTRFPILRRLRAAIQTERAK